MRPKRCQYRDETCTFETVTSGPRRSDLTMRTSSISRSKISAEPLAESWPEIPLLETDDLPSETDWSLMNSLCLDHADVRDIDPDIDRLTH